MTNEEFIALFRVEMHDSVAPYGWSDADILRHANSALNFMASPAERGGAAYFRDRETWASISVDADDPVVDDVDSITSIIRVERATLSGVDRPLDIMSTAEYEQGIVIKDYGIQVIGGSLSWTTATGVPRVLLTDYVAQAWRLAPIPTVAYTLTVWGQRLPLVDMTVSGTDPGWKENPNTQGYLGGLETAQDERTLLVGTKAYAYGEHHDADLYDQKMFERQMGLFRSQVSDIEYRLRRARTPPRAVRPNQDYL